jgi:hypothetical protein
MSITTEGPVMALEAEIRTYEEKLPELMQHHAGKYVVIHGSEFVGAFDTFGNAALDRASLFGRT